MTILQAFANFLVDKGFGQLGQNIYLYHVPNSKKAENNLFYLIPSGGYPAQINKTGEMIKAYQIMIYYRNNSARKVDEVLNELEKTLNCASCVHLDGFELVEIRANQFVSDQDLDQENRIVGMITCQVQVYSTCEDS